MLTGRAKVTSFEWMSAQHEATAVHPALALCVCPVMLDADDDNADDDENDNSDADDVAQTMDREVTEYDPCLFTQPETSNIHTIEALESCAILDIITPPYTEDRGDRPCHYYSIDPSYRPRECCI